jgi:hypothetical protein
MKRPFVVINDTRARASAGTLVVVTLLAALTVEGAQAGSGAHGVRTVPASGVNAVGVQATPGKPPRPRLTITNGPAKGPCVPTGGWHHRSC